MATKKKTVRKAPAKKSSRRSATHAVEYHPSTSIEVSFTAAGKPKVDIDPAVVAPGSDVIWHTAPGQRRAFTVVLNAGAAAPRIKQRAAPKPVGAGMANASLSEGLVLRSQTEQVVQLTIPLDATAGMWTCVIDAGGIRATTGVIVTGTDILVRPPRPKNRPGP